MDFSGVRVLVLGDVMLDHYIAGSVQRISPEAPVRPTWPVMYPVWAALFPYWDCWVRIRLRLSCGDALPMRVSTIVL